MGELFYYRLAPIRGESSDKHRAVGKV
jgi:hypothetical protein